MVWETGLAQNSMALRPWRLLTPPVLISLPPGGQNRIDGPPSGWLASGHTYRCRYFIWHASYRSHHAMQGAPIEAAGIGLTRLPGDLLFRGQSRNCIPQNSITSRSLIAGLDESVIRSKCYASHCKTLSWAIRFMPVCTRQPSTAASFGYGVRNYQPRSVIPTLAGKTTTQHILPCQPTT